MNVQQPQVRPAVQAVHVPGQSMMTSHDDYAHSAAMMSGPSSHNETQAPTQHVMFDDVPQIMAAPVEEMLDYDGTDHEELQDE